MSTPITASQPIETSFASRAGTFGPILIPALTMSVAWGLRGFIGGGSLGAMIPGALVALALCHSLQVPSALCGRIAAFGAIGIGFGGQETYGQTVSFVVKDAEMFWRGVVGIGVKGAVWGFLGGAVLGVGFVRGVTRRALFIALALLVAGTWLGWATIDHPKLLYFSNLLDRPREEVWAGLLIGGVAFLGWITFALRSEARVRVPLTFAGLGALGGGIGFALGGVSYAGGAALGGTSDFYPGWKQMEFTFGLCYGAALGWAAQGTRTTMAVALGASSSPPPEPRWLLPGALASGGLAAVIIWGSSSLPVRFNYTIAGAGLLALVFVSERAAWQVALTVTAGAFLLYVGKFFTQNHPGFHPAVATTVALILTTILGVWVARRQASGRDMATWGLRVLLWTSVGAAVAHAGWHRVISPALMIVVVAFVSGAGVITLLTRPRT